MIRLTDDELREEAKKQLRKKREKIKLKLSDICF